MDDISKEQLLMMVEQLKKENSILREQINSRNDDYEKFAPSLFPISFNFNNIEGD